MMCRNDDKMMTIESKNKKVTIIAIDAFIPKNDY